MRENVEIASMALDGYYSSRLKIFGERTHIYVISKKNIRNFGTEWTKVLKRIIEASTEFPRNYFQRNLSEAGFSSDKRRFG